MKTTLILCLSLMLLNAYGQSRWTTPVRIAPGNENDIHPTIADGYGWLSNSEELLAFSRNGKNICVLRTTSLGASWSDSLQFLTSDSADNDFPSLIRPYPGYPRNDRGMLVWQGRRNGNLEIFFSKLDHDVWSPPQRLTNNAVDDQYPHIGMNDSLYYAVWEQQGTIMFSEYVSNSWSLPVRISPAGDTLNQLPQVSRIYNYPPPLDQPFVVWQTRKADERLHSLVASRRSETGWTSPDTLVSGGDNRRPRFFKYSAQSFLTWDHNTGSTIAPFGGYVSIVNGKARVGSISALTSYSGNSQNASVNGVMIITTSGASPLYLAHGVATWESATYDSIGADLGIYGGWFGIQKLSPAGATMNRNPTISQGTPAGGTGFTIRYWTVWESNVGNRWRLYGSNAMVIIDDVAEERVSPDAFHLFQNYPNPFNPATEIRYQTPKVGRVSLKVFDLLGREIATLVDEVQDSGSKSVTFEASGLASGVYFYRLQAGAFTETKKLILLR